VTLYNEFEERMLPSKDDYIELRLTHSMEEKVWGLWKKVQLTTQIKHKRWAKAS
jgi:hypothetical protein